MKMISRILLLLILSSCLCATFVVNVTQSSYQAEENHSITLEWTFPTKTQGTSRDLFIYCSLVAPHKESVLYQVHEGVEIPDSQDDQFSGRVQIDKDVLREGRIRLHVSRLRTEDSGLYVCDVKTEDGSNNADCRLSVTGQEKVVGGHDLIHAKVGDDVILPCHLEPPFDMNSLTIEWRFQGQIIHVQRRGAKDDESSDPKYQGRTSMFHDEFKKGNISLRLIKVTKEDEGNYTCFVPKLQSQVRKVKVTLKLDKNVAQGNLPATRGPDPGVIGGVVVVGALILIFIIIYVVRRHRSEQIFPCWNNKSQNVQGRNDGDHRENGNQGDGAEERPLQDVGKSNQSV
ncbi:sodium channel subunit beta-4-like isoform X2 [Xiphophorus hellerii]|uniref:sodium channel subunit beta-4-like isoform X2 n=1 Tax=Xiphophorus hellerii TaxID=8084 RepID=UPI0013B45094|nr:sodium channel subunit beta-4-like isoform X2 [Xiphophorus hellerii]